MVTTIQLDEDTKEQLAAIARKLGMELKKNVTYNETIKYLLQLYPNLCDKSKLSSLRGVISYKEAINSLKELRDLDKKREKSLQR